ncbi:MAG TPA: hypothetical protein VFV20_09275, partial [Candidatus Limnocylindria bacterium]|nr:hypothetical protein [Candidatus Limnocylindria bacterium]
MSSPRAPAGIAPRLFLIASAIVAITALVVAFGDTAAKRPAPEPATMSPFPTGEPPLTAEADVFRTHAGVLAIDPGSEPR